jgi:hypothetical protein
MIKKENLYYVKLGEINENHYHEDIREIYGDVTRASIPSTGGVQDNKYWIEYDWVNEERKIKIELKSRNIRHNAFPTTMIGNNKIVNALKDTEYQYVYLFGFLDGLYAWELNEENLRKCEVKIGSIGVGGNDYTPFNWKKEQLYIPVEDMVKISDKGIIQPPLPPKVYKFLGDLP